MERLKHLDLQAFNSLASYLRRNPSAVSQDPAILAERFGVPQAIVQDVVRSVQDRVASRQNESTPVVESAIKPVKHIYHRVLQPTAKSVRRGWCFSTASPSWFVGITTFIAIILLTVLSRVMSISLVETKANNASVQLQGAVAIITLFVVGLQYLCFFRHGMARYAFYGGLVNWIMLSVLSTFVFWLSQEGKDENSTLIVTLLGMFGLLFLAAIYAGMGVVAAVLGAIWKIRRSDARKENLTRQELLERLFEIEERIRMGPSTELPETGILDYPIISRLRHRSVFNALALGLGLGFAKIALLGSITQWFDVRQGVMSLIFVILFVVLGLAWLVCVVMFAFVARRFNKAILLSLVFALAYLAPEFIPVGMYGIDRFIERLPWSVLSDVVGVLLVTSVAAMGVRVEERAIRDRRLKDNDPAALLAELLDIQIMLTPATSDVCVMVVDAARSAEMKAAADPLVVEYSFRMYQQLIRDISDKYGGTVHSTAGDGAVVAFPNATEAFGAAKRIQTDIDAFNRNVNRLRSPFRLRIGLHLGKIQDNIDKVQFTEVIDIAAHIQDVAPVGGIGMSEQVGEQLAGEAIVQLKDQVDGHTVMLVLNPTYDQ